MASGRLIKATRPDLCICQLQHVHCMFSAEKGCGASQMGVDDHPEVDVFDCSIEQAEYRVN